MGQNDRTHLVVSNSQLDFKTNLDINVFEVNDDDIGTLQSKNP